MRKLNGCSLNKNFGAVVVGGGIIGASAAWRLSQLGVDTAVVDLGGSRAAASGLAAGMLAPVTEACYGENDLLALNLESARRYPEFLSELSAASGQEVCAWPSETIFAAVDRDQGEALRRLFEFQESLGLVVRWLDRAACRELEPSLHPSTRAGVLASGDVAVDPRMLILALRAAAQSAGAKFLDGREVTGVTAGDRPAVTMQDGSNLNADIVVLAAGCWTGAIRGIPTWLARALRPVKGQIIRLRTLNGKGAALNHVIRTEDVYMVPRPSGEIVVGATVEEMGFSTDVTAGAVFELLRAAAETVPDIREMQLYETSAGLRPGTPDNGPLIGRTGLDGIAVAAGHFRNGVLLAPVTADAIASLVVKGQLPAEVAAFAPERFAP